MNLPVHCLAQSLAHLKFVETICRDGCRPKGSDVTLSLVKEGSAYAKALWHIWPPGMTSLETMMAPHLPIEILNPVTGKPKCQRQRK